MINNTFFIVVREADMTAFEKRVGRDQWGWEFADNVEMTDYQTAKSMREEYQAAMPHHVVRIRAVPIKAGLYTQSQIEAMRPNN